MQEGRRVIPTPPDTRCPYCPGASLLITRGGHDPACPVAQHFPVTTTRPARKATHDHP